MANPCGWTGRSTFVGHWSLFQTSKSSSWLNRKKLVQLWFLNFNVDVVESCEEKDLVDKSTCPMNNCWLKMSISTWNALSYSATLCAVCNALPFSLFATWKLYSSSRAHLPQQMAQWIPLGIRALKSNMQWWIIPDKHGAPYAVYDMNANLWLSSSFFESYSITVIQNVAVSNGQKRKLKPWCWNCRMSVPNDGANWKQIWTRSG